jgi:hypothetical protein
VSRDAPLLTAGSGFELATARLIAERMGGSLTVSNVSAGDQDGTIIADGISVASMLRLIVAPTHSASRMRRLDITGTTGSGSGSPASLPESRSGDENPRAGVQWELPSRVATPPAMIPAETTPYLPDLATVSSVPAGSLAQSLSGRHIGVLTDDADAERCLLDKLHHTGATVPITRIIARAVDAATLLTVSQALTSMIDAACTVVVVDMAITDAQLLVHWLARIQVECVRCGIELVAAVPAGSASALSLLLSRQDAVDRLNIVIKPLRTAALVGALLYTRLEQVRPGIESAAGAREALVAAVRRAAPDRAAAAATPQATEHPLSDLRRPLMSRDLYNMSSLAQSPSHGPASGRSESLTTLLLRGTDDR